MLTLITATLNAEAFLARALASAAVQAGEIQHIVIDGGSSDGTVALCRDHPGVDIVVAPGSSIYEAWNLGIDRARGDAVMFLNADDEMMPETGTAVAHAFERDPAADIVAGRALFVDDLHPERAFTLAASVEDRLDLPQLASGVPAINGMAFRRELFLRYGRFDTCYRVAGDRAFLLRLVLASTAPHIAPVDAVLYRYHIHAGSLTLQRGLTQRLRIAHDHIALARSLLASDLPPEAALWIRHMRRRDAAVAMTRCLAAGRVAEAIAFARAIFA